MLLVKCALFVEAILHRADHDFKELQRLFDLATLNREGELWLYTFAG